MFNISFANRSYSAPLVEAQQGVFRVRDATDPIVVGLQGISSSSNFAPIKLAGFSFTQAVDFNAIKKFQRINYDYLRSLQFAEPGEYGSIDKKMNFLVNHDGAGKRPYWSDGGQYRFGTILFGGQLVKVEMSGNAPKEYIKRGQYPNNYVADIVFYHVEGMPADLMRSGLSGIQMHEKYPYWVVKASSFNNDLVQTDTPRGATHFHVVWNTYNYPSNYADGRLYIAKAFLK
jgi:hypothetical protein